MSEFIDRISKWNVILGLVIAIAAFILMLFGAKIINALFQNKSDDVKGTYLARFKIMCLILVLLGCVFVLFVNS